MPQQNSDFAAVVTFLAALVFSDDVAAIVGPYITIMAAASIGASFALARRTVGTRADGRMFFVRTVGLALMLTVALSQALAAYYPAFTERVALVPIALMLGYGGDEMPKLFAASWRKILSMVDVLRKGPPP